MAYTGGRRLRLVQDNFKLHIESALGELGWFSAGRRHRPVKLLFEPEEHGVAIEPNMIAISGEELSGVEIEIGSDLQENTWDFYIDVYAESNDIGVHLAGDIRDILRGKMASAGASSCFFPVLDLAMATPPELFSCEMVDVEMQRVRFYEKPFQKFWWVIHCGVVDYYDNESD